ncbi:MAG: alpha-galactosidase [Bacteroidales bacterium]|nr:alpha-galactosidase [Bacteroidales bacterium]
MRKKMTAVLGCLLAGLFFAQTLGAQAVLRQDTDEWDCGRWAESAFARGKVPPFSFTYGGVPSAKLLPRWRFSKAACAQSKHPNETLTAYTWTDPGTGLQVECRVKRFSDWNAAEWVLSFRNTSGADTPPLAEVRTLDLVQPAGGTVFYADGPYFSAADFCSRDTLLTSGQTLHLEPDGGRSSSHTMPYFNVRTPAGGIVYGIGWTGSWTADITRTDVSRRGGGFQIKAGLRDFDAYLRPGEEIRVAAVFLVPWEGEDRMDGQNRLRRFILAHHHPEASGRPVEVPIFSGLDHHGPWPCDEFVCLTDYLAIASIRQQARLGTNADVFWIDAGWFDRAGDYKNGYWWHNAVGNWTPDRQRFPDGIAPVADAAHEAGSKLLLWYEPERANVDSDWAHAHPEWMLAASGAPAVPLDEPVDSAFIVNLGNPAALEWVCNEILQSITDNKVDVYRQDFNIMPEPFWLNNDEPGRRGMTEVKYIAGLYRYLDFLHEQLPHLIMDNCAGGGRRLDFEMISRAITLWRSDYSNYIDGKQCHGYYLNQWLPVNCTCGASMNPYDYRSILAAGVNFTWGALGGYSSPSIEGEKALIRQFRGLKDYFLEDFYPLSGYGDITGADQWMAYQLDRPSDGTGIVVAFRRKESPDSTYTVQLLGLDPDATYRLSYDPDVATPGRTQIRLGHKPDPALLIPDEGVWTQPAGPTFEMTGRALADGLLLTLPDRRSSLLLRYSRK